MQRQSLTATETALGLERLKQLAGCSTEELAAKVGRPAWEVYRYIRLAHAPHFIQSYCDEGMPVDPEGLEPGETNKPEYRQLDFIAALEFEKVYKHLATTTNPEHAQNVVEGLIRKALRHQWGYREILKVCQRLRGMEKEQAPEAEPETAPGAMAEPRKEDAELQEDDAGRRADDAEAPDAVETASGPAQATAPSGAAPVAAAPPPVTPGAPPARPANPYQNPAWEYVGDVMDPLVDVLFHPSKFKDLTGAERRGAHFLLDDLKKKLGPMPPF